MRTGRRLFAQVFGELLELFSVHTGQYANAISCRQVRPWKLTHDEIGLMCALDLNKLPWRENWR